MQIQMLETRSVAPDHITVTTYAEGETYDAPAWLGEELVAAGWAKETKTAPAGEAKTPPRSRRGRR